MSAYSSRQSTLHDGNIISAALFNNEFNAILNAFTYASTSTTGHRHDGTAGQGGNIFKIGDQDFLNKVVIESNEIKFFIEVGGAAVEQLNIVDGVLAPETTNDIDLGTSSKRFKTIYGTTLDISGTAVNTVRDEDNMASDDADGLATQQSIKAYVDAQTVSYGGIQLAVGGVDATPAFDLSDATNYPTSSLSGTITNAQLAGSIANDKLSNSTVSFGGISLALGGSDATPAFNLSDATNYPAGSLTGTIAGVQIAAGAVTESRLADDAVTTAKIADGAVNTDRLGTQAVTGAKIAANTIGSGNLDSNCVLTAAITDANVTTAKIADSAVTGAKIANTTITPDKLTGSITGSQLSTPITFTDGKSQEENAIVTITNSNSGTSQDGRMLSMIAGSNHRGSVGYTEVQYGSGTFFAGAGCGLLATSQFSTHIVQPCDEIGDFQDNAVDLGASSNRFDDVYATNGTIQTSDRNEKQDIAELSDAERRVAVAAKGLLRKFKWIDAVTEKGDDARIHFGIIAQDLQAAFAAESLDAGNYAMFISTTWWEHEGETYTQDAPSGATEKTRLGVRYPELLAFIIAAL